MGPRVRAPRARPNCSDARQRTHTNCRVRFLGHRGAPSQYQMPGHRVTIGCRRLAVTHRPVGVDRQRLAADRQRLAVSRHQWSHFPCPFPLPTPFVREHPAEDSRTVAGTPRLSVTGGGGEWQPGLLHPTPRPPPHIRKRFPGNNKIYHRGPKLEVDFRSTNFCFWRLTPPSPA